MQTVLVVDDNMADAYVAGGCVEEHGLTATYASNGREAIEMMGQDTPDCVLTDLRMPVMDGLELVCHMREQFAQVPVVLMTNHGNEDIAVQALKCGASSYVPKQVLRARLGAALSVVREAVEAIRGRETVRELLDTSESRFVLGYQPMGQRALISHLQDTLTQMHFCDQTGLLQIATALTEAISNAVDHGNLELNSSLRETQEDYRKLGDERAQIPPYRDRRVYVTARITRDQVTFTIRDEGPGFDPSTLPDPTDPENLFRPSGRGIMLIYAFMDEVRFNASGNEITMVKRRSTDVPA